MRPGENDTVMICKHIWQSSRCKVAVPPPPARNVRWDDADAPREFTREDGTKGAARFYVKCRVNCCRIDPKKVDYIETVWKDGRFQVADFRRW